MPCSISTPTILLEKLITAEGIYMPPMLIDKLKYLYTMLDQADQLPGQDAYLRFDELSDLFRTI